MEVYNLVTKGDLVAGTTLYEAEEHLKQLRLDDQAIENILHSKRSCVIKRNVTLSDAEKIRSLFFKGGIMVELDLQLNPACLSEGLRQRKPKPKPAKRPLSQYVFDDGLLQPTIYAGSGTSKIECTGSSATISLARIGHQWNPVLLFMGAALATVYIELYLVRVLSMYLGLGFLASVLGIIFLVISVVLLPGLIQPLNVFKIELSGQSLLLIEQFHWHPQQRQYGLWNETGEYMGLVVLKREVAELYDDHNQLMYQWDKLLAVRSVGDEEVEAIHEGAVSNIQSDVLSNYWGYVQFLGKLVKWGGRGDDRDWSFSSGTPIIDDKRRLVGLIYNRDHLGLQLLDGRGDLPRLLGFTVAVLRTAV